MSEDLMPFDLPKENSSIIKVLGVGGGGCNAVNHMFRQGIKDVNFIVCNTDAQALANSPVPLKVQLGEALTEGRGAGNKPERGRQAAIESLDEVLRTLSGQTKMVFITAGMGGGTGTGAAPVIAKATKEIGILTVGIVTIPFRNEGMKRVNQAIEGIAEMSQNVDALIVINNEKLREIFGDLTATEAFGRADSVLTTAAKGIAEIITVHGHINVDFADVQTVMSDSGVALMGSARGKGTDRAMSAIQQALNSPLLNNNDITGARNILLNITSGNSEVTLDEIGQIIDYIQEAAGFNADVIWGNTNDSSLGEDIAVTVIATGFRTDILPEVSHLIDMQKKHQGNAMQKPIEKPEKLVFTITDSNTPAETEIKPFERQVKPTERLASQSVLMSLEQETGLELLLGEAENKIAIESEEPVKEVDLQPINRQEGRTVIKTLRNLDDIEKYENEPAFMRKAYNIGEMKHSVANKVSRFTLSDDEDSNPVLREDNAYLHKRVD